MPTAALTPFEVELAAEVDDALRGATDLAKLHAAATALRSRPERLLAKIRFIRQEPDLLAALAGRSYGHTNGFTKVKLVAKDRFSVRIHLWRPSSTPRGDVAPHAHRWAFASWVVCGPGVRERLYERSVESDPRAHPYYRYQFPGGADVNSLWYVEPVERTALIETQVLDRPAGSVYVCPLKTVHTVGLRGEEFAATVVVQGPHTKGSVPVYSREGDFPKAHERPITVTELRDDLVALEQALARSMEAKTLRTGGDAVTLSALDAAREDSNGAFR